MNARNIVAIGGSAGAGPVVRKLLAALPKDLDASLFVVTHFPNTGPGPLLNLLREISALPISVAIDGQPIEPGRIYLAAADRHLLVDPGIVRLGRGPHENMMRPAIDPLFRSAALAFGPRAIGVVLSGYLNDGAAGLAAIKSRGGLALVQHPLDAEVAEMPRAALAAVDPDQIVSQDDLADVLVKLAHETAPRCRSPPDPALELEVAIAAGARLGSAALGDLAEPSALSCPRCNGVLSELKTAGPLRYRCQTGHAFTAEAAFESQQAQLDDALMIALRVMEERVTLVARMAKDARVGGRNAMAELYERRAEEYGGYAETLRQAAVRSLAPSAAAAE
jgi:two-component system chemotaxis response regulator CheB